jgi:hypothetical protein
MEGTSYYTACEDVEDQSSLTRTCDCSRRNRAISVAAQGVSFCHSAPQSSDGPIPLPLLNRSLKDDSFSSVPSKRSFAKSHWELNLLCSEVGTHGHLLPLYDPPYTIPAPSLPLAASCDVLGMLSIHWVVRGFALPPILSESTRRPSPLKRVDPVMIGFDPVAVLKLLENAVPGSARKKVHGYRSFGKSFCRGSARSTMRAIATFLKVRAAQA